MLTQSVSMFFCFSFPYLVYWKQAEHCLTRLGVIVPSETLILVQLSQFQMAKFAKAKVFIVLLWRETQYIWKFWSIFM